MFLKKRDIVAKYSHSKKQTLGGLFDARMVFNSTSE